MEKAGRWIGEQDMMTLIGDYLRGGKYRWEGKIQVERKLVMD